MRVSARTMRHCLPPCMRALTRISRLPSFPPGWRLAKSSCRNPFSTSSVIASASPIASAAVVLAVGTRFMGHASSVTLQSSATSAACARVEAGPPNRFEQAEQLVGLAAVRQRNHHIVAPNRAEVSVHRLGGMQEERRCAGAGERRGDLLADDPRLAHSGEDHTPLAVKEQLHRAVESRVESINEREDGRGFGFEYFARQRAISHEG